MSHYFLHDEHLKKCDYNVVFSVNNHEFHLVSNNGVFSKTRIDEGPYLLISSVLKLDIKGDLLDLGCGYGPVGITLKYFFRNINLFMSDVNSTCLELTRNNLKLNNEEADVILSDGFKNIAKSFDFIIFNPPIRIGKLKLFEIYEDVYKHLNQNGQFIIVIRKDKGAESHKKFLETLFEKVELLEGKRGYQIYRMTKIICLKGAK